MHRQGGCCGRRQLRSQAEVRPPRGPDPLHAVTAPDPTRRQPRLHAVTAPVARGYRWDDDVVFKNQAREPKKEVRRHIAVTPPLRCRYI